MQLLTGPILRMPKTEMVNFNFSMPKGLADEFRRVGDIHGEKNKMRYAVAGAAVLKLLEMPEAEMQELVAEVYAARNFEGKLARMIAAAKAKAKAADAPAADVVNVIDEQDRPLTPARPATPPPARRRSRATKP